jgi:hypothetical protein
MTALERIQSTQLGVDVRGDSVRVVVAADKYTVARISEGMNDRELYARMFTAARDLYLAIRPLAFASPDAPPPGVHPNHWRGAVSAALEAMAKARGEA